MPRRRHEHYGKRYVPLKWSNNLKAQAQRFANHLASTNKFYHDRNRGRAGENLASNSGSSRRPTAESVVYRWVEAEMGKSPPANGHLTAALWRASKYVGCADAKKGNRHVQVCRYFIPGECAVHSFSFINNRRYPHIISLWGDFYYFPQAIAT